MMRTIGATTYTGRGIKYTQAEAMEFMAGMICELRSSTIYWRCGHVTDHGSIERPERCPICSCDRLRLTHQAAA
jgi:hypothetical protein